MASQTQGIQQLLAAEKRAAEKVAEARKRKWNNLVIWLFSSNFDSVILLLIISLCNVSGKARRLKQAKEEAQAEIEVYRAEREKQFKDFESKVCCTTVPPLC